MGLGGLHQLFGCLGVGQVCAHGVGAATVGLHCAHHVGCGVFVAGVAEHDVRPIAGQAFNNRPADTAGSAGHHGGLTF
jgi:hypothetical protein